MVLSFAGINNLFPGEIAPEQTSRQDLWSMPGIAFSSTYQADLWIHDSDNGVSIAGENGRFGWCQVVLPDGVTIEEVIVYILDDSAGVQGESWTLWRDTIEGTGFPVALATAAGGTKDTSIVNPVVDNTKYNYWFQTSSLDNGDMIQGARIIYKN